MNKVFKWRLWFLYEMGNPQEMIFGGKMFHEIENGTLYLFAPIGEYDDIPKFIFPHGRWLMIEQIENEEETP